MSRNLEQLLNRQQFSWRLRKPASAEVDPTFTGPDFSPPLDELPSPKWYFDQFMDQSVFELMAEESNIYAAEKNTPLLKIHASRDGAVCGNAYYDDHRKNAFLLHVMAKVDPI